MIILRYLTQNYPAQRTDKKAWEARKAKYDDTARIRKKRILRSNQIRLTNWNMTSWDNKD